MENPATWGEAERIVRRALKEAAVARTNFECGLSTERRITNALREATLLVEPEDLDVRAAALRREAITHRERVILAVWEQLLAPEVRVLREEAPDVYRFCQALHEKYEHGATMAGGAPVATEAKDALRTRLPDVHRFVAEVSFPEVDETELRYVDPGYDETDMTNEEFDAAIEVGTPVVVESIADMIEGDPRTLAARCYEAEQEADRLRAALAEIANGPSAAAARFAQEALKD